MQANGASAAGSAQLWIGALGPLECLWDGRPIALGGTKQQMVLALLVLEANSVVAVDRLIEWVWPGDAQSRHAATLQVYVSNLRRAFVPASEALGRPLIVTRRPGYVLELESDECDVLRFEALRWEAARASEGGEIARAVSSLRAALGLWRGVPMSGLPVDPESAGVLRHLELARVTVLEQTAEAELAVGRHRELLAELQSWVADHPLDERLRGHLMIALYRSGRQAEALAAYRAGRELLVEELGIDPSRELRDLETRILNQDPSLDFVPPRTSPLLPLSDGSSTELRGSVVAPRAHLEVDGGAIPLEDAVTTIGRHADRQVVLTDPGVSRVHAEIRRVGRSFRLVDLGSANGTVVNGEHVSEHALADGDTIRIGGVELVFRTA